VILKALTLQITSYTWSYKVEKYVDSWGTVVVIFGKFRVSIPNGEEENGTHKE
jgi:hypothetical protein